MNLKKNHEKCVEFKKMDKRTKRIMKELGELEKSRSILNESGIYFHYDDSDVSILYAMIIGPDDTPYEGGFYFFEFVYPLEYPMVPPIARYCTQGTLYDIREKSMRSVRFNPNLYTCGKVCLSMLNTWEGPGWTPTCTITNVFVAIQGLVLNENPMENEPGYEGLQDEDGIRKYKDYNQVIEYANYKIAVMGMYHSKPSEVMNAFHPTMKEYIIKNQDKYRRRLIEKRDYHKIIEMPCYRLKVDIHYEALISEFEEFIAGMI